MGTARPIEIARLGEPRIASPLTLSTAIGDGIGNFVPDRARVRFQAEIGTGIDDPDLLFEKAGPRERLFFEPAKTRAAIATCGGLCPGLNNVIRSAVLELHHNYGVPEILGIRYGYQGLNPAAAHPPVALTPDFVEDIHKDGGSVLGSSRGPQPVQAMVDYLAAANIQVLLLVGGDGTQRGAHEIAAEIRKRKLAISVIGIPKTIDNDIMYVRRSFGFVTAIEEAKKVFDCAHNESKGVPYGIGLVKVMGRESGFIAAVATIASQEVNFCFVPEVTMRLDGAKGFLDVLKNRMLARNHAVIVVAEGAGQELMPSAPAETDASGNRKHQDIGVFLKQRIESYFEAERIPVSVKYIDPSYTIRSVAANSDDSLLCDSYARNAVHAAMAGKTDALIGFWNACFMHVPIAMAVESKSRVSPESDLWNGVIAATGQPRTWG
ncbi:MAG: Pyrophosphate--fructose 6-phosphate 1-phosphotransferase [Verrucomicrobia bacterium ADurb.Bin345]|nr:MAG: Pyrophosphate--fructose 6-phosphate 1-phosphotransferase [Verrucomicrobia bacterium ADurb.Bin345]